MGWPTVTPPVQNGPVLEEGVGVELPKLPALKNFRIFSVEFFGRRKVFGLICMKIFVLAGSLLERVHEQMSGWHPRP